MINSAPLYRYKCTDGALQALHFSATCIYLIILDEVLEIYQKKDVSSNKEKIQSFQRLFGLPVSGELHYIEYAILCEIKKEMTEIKNAL